MDQHSANSLSMQQVNMNTSNGMTTAPNGNMNSTSVPNPNTQNMNMLQNGNNQPPYGGNQAMPQNPQMQMNYASAMSMGMNPGAMNGMHLGMGVPPNGMNPNLAMGNMPQRAGMAVGAPNGLGNTADWRISFTRAHRANLIAKIYNEMVRVSSDPPPGIKLWMQVAFFELSLYTKARGKEDYIGQIFARLKSLESQVSDPSINRNYPNNGILDRLDFSFYNNMNPMAVRASNQPGGQPPMNMAPHNAGVGTNPNMYRGQMNVNNQPHDMNMNMQAHGAVSNMKPNADASKASSNATGPNAHSTSGQQTNTALNSNTHSNSPAEYWRQHASLKAKFRDDVEKVHTAFKKYVDHMRDQDETDQKKKLRYLLSYVQLCASVLSEDKATHEPRKLEELDKVYNYIVKIVNPYLNKLRTDSDRRTPLHPGGPNGSNGTADPNSSSGMIGNNSNAPNHSSQNTHQQQGGSNAGQQHHSYQQQTSRQGMQSMQQQQQALRQQQMAQQARNAAQRTMTQQGMKQTTPTLNKPNTNTGQARLPQDTNAQKQGNNRNGQQAKPGGDGISSANSTNMKINPSPQSHIRKSPNSSGQNMSSTGNGQHRPPTNTTTQGSKTSGNSNSATLSNNQLSGNSNTRDNLDLYMDINGAASLMHNGNSNAWSSLSPTNFDILELDSTSLGLSYDGKDSTTGDSVSGNGNGAGTTSQSMSTSENDGGDLMSFVETL